jgi:hypothetical protein
MRKVVVEDSKISDKVTISRYGKPDQKQKIGDAGCGNDSS